MLIRMLALALLIGATQAHAAQKKHKPAAAPAQEAAAAAPDAIDVDAMARAKDAASNTATSTDATTQDAATEVPATPAPSDAPREKEVAPAQPETAPATNTATKPEASSAGVPPLLAPTPDESERRLASACEARATALLDAAQKADYASATKDFDAKMHTSLPPAKFKQTWESLEKFGGLTARGQTHLAKSNGYIAVTIPLLFEKANLYAQVACGSDGRIAGFYVKPLNVPKS
ncbi:MAG: DUF3887 domain-containing protein [Dokdonella sp.]